MKAIRVQQLNQNISTGVSDDDDDNGDDEQ